MISSYEISFCIFGVFTWAYAIFWAMMPVRIFDSLFLVFGGPHGELGAATRYLNQRYTMPLGKVQGMLTDIGTEES